MRDYSVEPKNGVEFSKVIREILDAKQIHYKYLEHEPTPTSKDSARVRGSKLEEGAKAIILRGKKSSQNYMVVLPGNKMIDFKLLEFEIGEKLEFEKPEFIKNRYGLIIGGVPPFGHLVGIECFFDKDILKNENVSFNCGEQTCSITMKSKDLVEVLETRIGNWSR